jgi:hypothetical protein
VAISKDQRYAAFTTADFDNQIHILKLADDTVRSATIRVPTSGEEVTADFADVLAFDCTGEYLHFDAFAEGVFGQAKHGCWGLFVLRVEDLQCQSLLPLSPGLQVGNPSLAHTRPDRLVADYEYTEGNSTTVGMVALDLSKNELQVLLNGLSVYASPSFRGDDQKIVFVTRQGDLNYLNEASLSSDSASLVEGSVNPILWSQSELVYPVGFRSGTYAPPSGRLQLNPTTLSFGDVAVGSAVERSLEIQNAGNADLELIDVVLESADVSAYDFASAIGKKIAVGQRQALTLRFSPTRAGATAATLRFKTTVPGAVDVTAALAGTGTASTRDYWREVWQDFQNRYSYFEYKGVDWNAGLRGEPGRLPGSQPDAIRPESSIRSFKFFTTGMSPFGFPTGPTWDTRRTTRGTTRPELFLNYTTSGQGYQNLRSANVVYHAGLKGNWAHIQVDTFATDAFAKLSDADLDDVFAQYAAVDGWILDIRANNGGDETQARKIASRFADRSLTYGHVRMRKAGNLAVRVRARDRQDSGACRGRAAADEAGRGARRATVHEFRRVVHPDDAGLSRTRSSSATARAAPRAGLPRAAWRNGISITPSAPGSPTTRTVSLSRTAAFHPPSPSRPAPASMKRPSATTSSKRPSPTSSGERTWGDRLPLVSARTDADRDGRLDVVEFTEGTDPLGRRGRPRSASSPAAFKCRPSAESTCAGGASAARDMSSSAPIG